MTYVGFRARLQWLLCQTGEQRLQHAAESAEVEATGRSFALPSGGQTAVFLDAFERAARLLPTEIHLHGRPPAAAAVYGSHEFTMTIGIRSATCQFGQHNLAVRACQGQVRARVTWVEDGTQWPIALREVTEAASKDLLWLRETALGL